MRVFYTDNATVNNIIIRIIYNRLRPDILNPYKRRVKYLDYIINLATIVFLFSNDQAFIEAEILKFDNINYLNAQLNF
jgi:hypothetical protein